MELREGSIISTSHTDFAERRDFKELGISQRVLKHMTDSNFKELKVAMLLKISMGGANNRPLLRARKLHRNSTKVDKLMLVFIVFMILQSYRKSSISGATGGVY